MRPPFGMCDIDGLVIDMDGVLWRGSRPLPGLEDFFRLLRRRSIPFVLATNNASHPPEHYVTRLAGYGIAVDVDEILTPAQATALFMRRDHPLGTSVFVLGGEGLRRAMLAAGFRLVWFC